MAEATYLKLEKGESVVIHAASRIFSAYVVAKQAREDNQDELIGLAVQIAVKLATRVDKAVQTPEEVK